MALPSNSYVIFFDALSDERREVANSFIKAKANGWWHNFPNVWIAGGHNAVFWRDGLQHVIEGTGSSVLVLSLPASPSDRAWAFQGPNSGAKTKWLYDIYTGRPKQ